MNLVRLSTHADPALAPANSDSAAYVASQIVKAEVGGIKGTGAGVLYGVTGYNSGAAQFLQVFDSSTLPADTAVPAVVIAIAATSNFSIDFGVLGRGFVRGCVICNSSTGPTKTIGAANCWINARFL